MSETITILEAFNISLISMIVISTILYILTLILDLFKIMFSKNSAQPQETAVANESLACKEDDKEELIVALVAAAIAGKDKPDGNLHIKRITRIK